MYCGDIYQLNSEPGRGRRWGHIGFVSAAVELVRTWTCCGRAAVELFASPEDAWRALWALLGEALLARRAGGGPDFGAFVKWSKRLAASGFDKQLGFPSQREVAETCAALGIRDGKNITWRQRELAPSGDVQAGGRRGGITAVPRVEGNC